jgi:(1->4)-alpha-D-glucan 1-alpha-D-glucosylmutase
LEQCSEVIDYLDRLGVSDLYLSPLFHARTDSPHGYDVVDHTRIEPAFGGRDALDRLGKKTRAAGMGVLLDIVPNHMGINDPNNLYWNDVLENGPRSKYATFFDIEWDPPGCAFPGRVLLPFLGKRFGQVLEDGELMVQLHELGFSLRYADYQFPLTPLSWPEILEATVEYLPLSVDAEARDELLSIAFQLRQLSGSDLTGEDWYREQSLLRRRLKLLQRSSRTISFAIETTLQERYCDANNPKAIDALERLLSKQFYRLSYWKVAVDEINYRRFFDINDLAALRVEEPVVFEAVHRLTFDLLDSGILTGLRIDHPDGLSDPAAYFLQLQTNYRQLLRHDPKNSEPHCNAPHLYIVAEKILSRDESLPEDWAISGTTGYDLLNLLSEVLVDQDGTKKLQSKYADITRIDQAPRDVAYDGKQTILQDAMASEVFVLASRLFRMARAHRSSYDFTLPVLQRALREYIACFPVYRTYIRPFGWDIDTRDHGYIREAIRWAKIRNPTMSWAALEFLQDILLLHFPNNLSLELRLQWRQFAVRLQQLTGPVTAKGLEDTAFYRYYPLASLNEVGGELGSCGISVDSFHAQMQRRASDWPHALSATATHDTKRGEDVRARLHVLSEIPERYAKQFSDWCDSHTSISKTVDTRRVPDTNAKYFIFQTLLGTWPVTARSITPHAATCGEYIASILTYLEKAFREAKQHTSWRSPSFEFEAAMRDFVSCILDLPESKSFKLIDELAIEIAGPGYVNSLAQLVLKATLPGVPDFYQGTEYWSFCLVDPDNRQPVDYAVRASSLTRLQADFELSKTQTLRSLTSNWCNELKQFFVMRLLRMRRECHELLAQGDYQPISVAGVNAAHVIAFQRRLGDEFAVVVVPRLPFQLIDRKGLRSRVRGCVNLNDFSDNLWADTSIELNDSMPHRFQEHLTGEVVEATGNSVLLSDLFARLPFAVMTTFKRQSDLTPSQVQNTR